MAIAAFSAAAAQDSVTVNPQGAQVLYDPGTGQERVVPPLLQPWQDDAVKLTPPGKRKARHKTTTAATTPPETSTPAVSEPETPPPPRKVRRTASATPKPAAPPPQQSAPSSNFSDFTDLISPPSSPPPPKRTASVAPPKKVEPPREKPVQKASIEPTKPAKGRSSPRESIAFSPNATDPSISAVATMRNLASALNTALGDANARVQLMAYAGSRGEKSSDTRRLSLKRALVIRQLLIDDGVPSERIDVFALGGAEDNGPLDRVDVFVKS
jgi:outer membrane protein OmpA-like peptidoglycan-associated protein